MTANVGQIGPRRAERGAPPPAAAAAPAPGHRLGRLAQVADAGHGEPLDERGLPRPIARHDQLREPGPIGSLGNRERPGRVAELAAQRQLAEHGVRVQRRAETWPLAASTPSASAASNPGPTLRMNAGARSR